MTLRGGAHFVREATLVPFIQAANFTPAQRTRVDLVVLHSMENSEKPSSARGVAEWFAGPNAPRASAHYCVDAGEVIACVREEDVAWAAPGANRNGIQIEQAGHADQSASQWLDPYSTAMLQRMIPLMVEICRRWTIPAVIVGPEALRQGLRGITTHNFVTLAFRKSTHTDPGIHYPLEWVVSRVAALLRMPA